MKNRVLKLTLLGMLIISSLSFSTTKQRKRITAIKAKQIALMKVPGATFANVLESKIQDIKIYGDFFGIEDVAAVEDVLRDVKYEREDVLKALETIDITRYFAGISREEIAEAVVG